MLTVYEPGDLVAYNPNFDKDNMENIELGVVKRINERTGNVFVFYHTGGTCASTPVDRLIKLRNSKFIIKYKFKNEYAIRSLLERSLRIKLQDGEYDDLIQDSDVRDNIGGILINMESEIK